jgi:hypothetical protein
MVFDGATGEKCLRVVKVHLLVLMRALVGVARRAGHTHIRDIRAPSNTKDSLARGTLQLNIRTRDTSETKLTLHRELEWRE